MSGLTAIATASPHNFEYLESLGADAVFEWRRADLRHSHEPDELSKYGTLSLTDYELLKRTNHLVDGPHFSLAYDVLGEAYHPRVVDVVEPSVEVTEFALKFKGIARQLFEDGKLTTINIDVNRGGIGLEGVLKGMDELRNRRASAQKLVYTL
ncbi:hypothetical protein F5Y16DRAFT_403454 [Xylariaceae sp. FL0255]|nr:hypothetical protein F5Y16DRAFT_403454 [Xylariaceae sp. FL0255]